MDEYISREEAVKRINSCIFTAQDAWESGYNTAMAEIMERIKHMPIVDVQPVKHGRWKYYKNNGIINTYICTNCHGKVEMAIDVEPSKFKYCPNCGSKNEGGDKK